MEQVESATAAPKGATDSRGIVVSLNRLRKKCFSRRRVTAAAKAGAENKLVIAAVNRCATQKQAQTRLFPQAVKRYPDTKRLGVHPDVAMSELRRGRLALSGQVLLFDRSDHDVVRIQCTSSVKALKR